jgi:hypothetical protein
LRSYDFEAKAGKGKGSEFRISNFGCWISDLFLNMQAFNQYLGQIWVFRGTVNNFGTGGAMWNTRNS